MARIVEVSHTRGFYLEQPDCPAGRLRSGTSSRPLDPTSAQTGLVSAWPLCLDVRFSMKKLHEREIAEHFLQQANDESFDVVFRVFSPQLLHSSGIEVTKTAPPKIWRKK